MSTSFVLYSCFHNADTSRALLASRGASSRDLASKSSVDCETHCAIPKFLILTEHTKLLANLHKKLSSHTPSMPTIKAKGTTTIASLPPFLPLVYLACGKRSSPCNTGSRSTTGRPLRFRPLPFSCPSQSYRRKSTGRTSRSKATRGKWRFGNQRACTAERGEKGVGSQTEYNGQTHDHINQSPP